MEEVLIEVFIREENKKDRIDIDRAVLYEMGSMDLPMSYHEELLKAIAILVRSRYVREIKNSRYAVVSDELPTISIQRFNDLPQKSKELLSYVIGETSGLITTYNGKAVDFYYTECCSGGTCNSEELLGFRINYLRRVLCGKCSSISTIKKINIHELIARNNFRNNLCFQETLSSLFNSIERDATGRILSVDFLGNKMSGEEFSKLLSADSNRVFFMYDSIFIKSQGNGLGLGICIEGGNKLALEGKNYIEIIKYYYTGVEVEQIYQYEVGTILKDKIIILDPGHGGSDIGNVTNCIEEKNINLSICLLCYRMLLKKGAKVILTRDSDVNVSLGDRVALINRERPDLFVSIHQNSFMAPGVNGVEGYYYPRDEEALVLGKLIVSKVADKLNIKERGMREGDYFLLREAKVSGVILECMYLSGNKDIEKYTEENYIRLAEAIYESICNYYDVTP